MLNQRILIIIAAVAALLLVPLIAMQFDTGVNWSPFDFVVAGGLLLGTGLAYEFVARRVSALSYRLGVAIALTAGLMLIWGNLAVGFIGSEGNPANLMYAGVLGVVIVGAILARLQPRGMAMTLLATALAQALVLGVAAVAWPSEVNGSVIIGNLFFVGLFAVAAMLFRHAAASATHA